MANDFACTDTKLRQLVRLMGRHYDAELRKVGLRMTQFWVLTQILEHDPARPCDLAKAMALEPSTLTRTLKPLIAAGWLEWVAGADRRTRSVRITSSGRMKRGEGLRRWQSADARVRELGIGHRTASVREPYEVTLYKVEPDYFRITWLSKTPIGGTALSGPMPRRERSRFEPTAD